MLVYLAWQTRGCVLHVPRGVVWRRRAPRFLLSSVCHGIVCVPPSLFCKGTTANGVCGAWKELCSGHQTRSVTFVWPFVGLLLPFCNVGLGFFRRTCEFCHKVGAVDSNPYCWWRLGRVLIPSELEIQNRPRPERW